MIDNFSRNYGGYVKMKRLNIFIFYICFIVCSLGSDNRSDREIEESFTTNDFFIKTHKMAAKGNCPDLSKEIEEWTEYQKLDKIEENIEIIRNISFGCLDINYTQEDMNKDINDLFKVQTRILRGSCDVSKEIEEWTNDQKLNEIKKGVDFVRYFLDQYGENDSNFHCGFPIIDGIINGTKDFFNCIVDLINKL